MYVFGCEEVDTDDLTTHFLFLYSPEDPVLILYDVIYSHIKGKIFIMIRSFINLSA